MNRLTHCGIVSQLVLNSAVMMRLNPEYQNYYLE